MDTRREQIKAYGASWTFTVYRNGVAAQLRTKGHNVGFARLYDSWADLMRDIEPVAWVHVFVRESDSIYLPR